MRGGRAWGAASRPRGEAGKAPRVLPPLRRDRAGGGGRGAARHPGSEKGARGCRDRRCPAAPWGRRSSGAGVSLEQRESREPGGGSRGPGIAAPAPQRRFLGRRRGRGRAASRAPGTALVAERGVSFGNEEGGATSSFQLAGAVDCYTSRFSAVVGLY